MIGREGKGRRWVLNGVMVFSFQEKGFNPCYTFPSYYYVDVYRSYHIMQGPTSLKNYNEVLYDLNFLSHRLGSW